MTPASIGYTTRFLVAVIALSALMGADCDAVEAPLPVFAQQRNEDRTLVFGTLAADSSAIATLEEFLPDGTSVFELHFRGGSPELRAWAPRIDQSFAVAGAAEGAAWNVVVGNDGEVRSQSRLELAGFSHRVFDATKRDGELTTFVGTAAEDPANPAALWYSLRQNGDVEWAFRTAATPSEVIRVLPRNRGAGTMVGTLGVGGQERPFIAGLDSNGAIETAFEFPDAVPGVVTDAELDADDEVLIVAVQSRPPPDAGVVVIKVEPRTGDVRWMTRLSVTLGSLQDAQVIALGDGALVAVSADGFSREPSEDTDILYLWLGAGGVFEQALLHGSAQRDVPLELTPFEGTGMSSGDAQATLRVGRAVQTHEVSRDAVEGCGRRFSITVNFMRLPQTAVSLSLPAGTHPFQPAAVVPQVTREFTDPLFVCLP